MQLSNDELTAKLEANNKTRDKRTTQVITETLPEHNNTTELPSWKKRTKIRQEH